MQVLGSPRSFLMDTSCGTLLRELQHIWTEIGESEADKDRMLLELEKECLEVYRRKVDEASNAKARLHQSVAVKEAELAALVASLGELNLHSQTEKRLASLKEQLASVAPLVEDLRIKREERIKQFAEIKTQIEKINGDISGYFHSNDVVANHFNVDEHDLSLRKLNEFQTHLRTLQKEKSDRLHKVLEYVNEVHCLCGVLGLDFGKTVSEVHPSLRETGPGQSTNISNDTLDGLAQTILKLKMEKKDRVQKLKDIVASLFELWNLLDASEEEKNRFRRVTCILGTSEQEVTASGVLSLEIIEQAAAEVERLTKLKAGRMKELVLKKRSELEEICRRAHIEPDMSTAPEKSCALIDSGIVDASELLANMEAQIMKAKEESMSRKEIMDRIDKWLAAREEESWLEEYNQDENRYSAGRGAHINLKRAERARVTVNKIPGIVDNLMSKTFAWEDERNTPFLYDGVRLVAILEEYKITRQQREEEKRRFRDQKKLQDLLLTEKEAMYGSKPSPKRSNSFKKANGIRANGNGSMTPMPRRVSIGSATPELLTPRSYSGRHNGYFRETRRLSTAPLNFVALSKEDTISFAASVCGSEPGSPPQG
ncbi:65-kDa microtubule-associated protein 6 [Magnolia sinica]|uniref:65-kDa microtubule-associated protein 6 n=1 Tax=Magnolia sinica TaxID=86752 RepID=UPI002657C80B|nr:65-kDa microtubule-associated protein 6 [Magnolia sinica]XP_058078303.1 65-kDa microtubule-associated protein 6 [Magnolia sinica]